MDRRNFIKNVSLAGSAFAVSGNPALSAFTANGAIISPFQMQEPWFDKAMRWAQVAFVENDPGVYDPQFWLDYFKKAHIDGVLLSA